MLKYSIVFYILSWLTITVYTSICPQSCATCSSSNQCLTCSQQYYASTISGTLQCLPCPDYCLSCTNQSSCQTCLSPYSTPFNQPTCTPCQIAYSASCQTPISASSCIPKYYLSNNYCVSCLLNCKQCNSNADCGQCIDKYYLNTTVLTCNLCVAQNCITCDQYYPNRCIKCSNGYSLLGDYTCSLITCNNQTIGPCIFCRSNNICSQCEQNYYWDSTSSSCVVGASILCKGANGKSPNQCFSCSDYAYSINTGVTTSNGQNKWCKAYINVDVNSVSYHQAYYYVYNDLIAFQKIMSTSYSLTQQAITGESSYKISSGDVISFASLPSYYRVSLSFKYRTSSTTSIPLTLSAEPSQFSQQQQSEELSLPASSSSIVTQTFNTTYVHSNNLHITVNTNNGNSVTFYLIQILIRLTKCPKDCYQCLNQQYCEICHSPQFVSSYKCVDACTIYYHYNQNRSCLASCPDKFYPTTVTNNNTVEKYCQPCVTPCQKCTSSSRCLSCVNGWYLLPNSTCHTSCPATTYPNLLKRICQTCVSPCKQCTSPTACTSCSVGFYNGSGCVNQCPVGKYGNSTLNLCVACQLPCLQCSNSATHCLKCATPLYFYDYECLNSCPEYYFPVTTNNTCKQCISPCLTCTSGTNCLSCLYNFYHQGQCLTSCPVSYYQNKTTSSCSRCQTNCEQCTVKNKCDKCDIGMCLLAQKGKCISMATNQGCTGEYYRAIDNSGYCRCQQCTYPCKQCLNSAQCLSCLQGYLYNNQCRSLCPESYYNNNSTFTCTPCSDKFTNCLICSQSNCTRCSTGTMIHNGQCLSVCPDFHYQESEKCHKCIAPCLKCTSFTGCLSCITPYIYLSSGSSSSNCLIQCPSTHVAISITNELKCQVCSSPCQACSVTTTNCTQCLYGYYLHAVTNGSQNQCVPNCSVIMPTNKLYNEQITSKCSQCLFPCLECRSGSQCLSCRIGYLNGYECKQCDNGMYENNGICQSCPSECQSCFTPAYCISCNQGFYLYGYSCISNTSICFQNGYYVLGRVCPLCQMPCKTCQLTSTNCQSCVSGYIYYPQSFQKCITQCPTSTYRSSQACLPCHSSCQSCATSPDYCFSCRTGYYLALSTMSCVSSCPINTYLQGTICQACKYPCRNCQSESQCLSCMSGTLVGFKCFTSCPTGKFTNQSAMCQNCDSPCKQCQGTATNCTQCLDGYYLFGNQCLAQCPNLYFGQSEAKQCLECLGLCEKCSSHINCVTCPSDLIYYFNAAKNYAQCLSQCPISFYSTSVPFQGATRMQCANCLSDCLTCTNNTECILCKNNKVQHLGQCVPECPQRMYSSSGVCQLCTQPCFNCSDAFTCTACMNNSFLLVGSAECIIGQTCPEGYYRITGTRLCNSQCPQNQYHQSNRTCSIKGCNTDQYLGLDYFCYKQCPENTIANKQYKCVECSNQQECFNGLFYDLKWWIKGEQIYAGVNFWEEPIYNQGVTIAQIELLGLNINYEVLKKRRMLQQSQYAGSKNIVVQLYPQESFSALTLEIKFVNALQTYQNPIQRISKKIFIQGYDQYPANLPSLASYQIIIGIILLLCALIGLIRNPYFTDFAQIIYVMGLINLHYPITLAQFLQSGYIAHLSKFLIGVIPQADTYEDGKFGYVTNMGLLSNCASNLMLTGIGLFIFGILFLIFKCLQRSLNYNKVEQEQQKPEISATPSSQNPTKALRVFRCLQETFIANFILYFLNRLVYISYLPLSIFTFAQIQVLSFSDTADSNTFISSILAIPLFIALIVYPIQLFIKLPSKSKYTFLLVRKFVIAIALVLARQNAEYIIGVIAVISLISAALIKAYGLEKNIMENRVLVIGELMQFISIILLSVFAMIGDGGNTSGRLAVGWVFLSILIVIMLFYFVFQLIRLTAYLHQKRTGINLWSKWDLLTKQQVTQNGQNDSENDSNADSFNSEKKQKQIQDNKNNTGKTITLEKLLADPANNQLHSNEIIAENTKKQPKSNKNKNGQNNFWTYNDDDEDMQNQSKESQAPKMLIRCINQFSDYDKNQKRQSVRQGGKNMGDKKKQNHQRKDKQQKDEQQYQEQ